MLAFKLFGAEMDLRKAEKTLEKEKLKGLKSEILEY